VTSSTNKPPPSADPPAADSREIERRVNDLRSRISDAGHEIDEYNAKTAAAMGGGVFLGLLAAGAGYDLANGKGRLWLVIGVSQPTLVWLVIGLAVGCLFLLAAAGILHRSRDRKRESGLAALEKELAGLLGETDHSPSAINQEGTETQR
jgi:hypothetical protein